MKKHLNKKYVPEARADSADGVDWSQALVNPLMPNLKFSTQSVTLRMPSSLVNGLKMLAHQRDVPYQSLMKMILARGLKQEFGQWACR